MILGPDRIGTGGSVSRQDNFWRFWFPVTIGSSGYRSRHNHFWFCVQTGSVLVVLGPISISSGGSGSSQDRFWVQTGSVLWCWVQSGFVLVDMGLEEDWF